ncbi:hypothetical protein CNMCM5623_008827 [Aspergillus felis]|uniref:Uncharacterized protein n=1 Tax=Aspergillus felis TaxID=1287682 RepID=A0A8H6Q1Q5_9EURO|nr:hypothetical protein CNMCM5623_008827 [Aspergillus felis]
MTWLKADRPPPIIQLLRTLLSRPQLAAYITTVHLDSNFYDYWNFQFKIPNLPVSGAELDQPIAFIRGTGAPYSDLWIQELRQGSIDAFVALLLAQLSNVRYLYLANDFTRQSALIGMVLRSAICEPVHYGLPDFRHLRDVSFLKPDGQDWARDMKVKTTQDVLPFFYLPSVQRMSASIENPSEFTWSAAHLPVPSKLTSLELTIVREAYLSELLALTQNLETLRWHWYYDFGVRDRFTTPIVDLGRIAAAISHVRGTLTDLSLSAECHLGGGDQFYPGIKIEGSLRGMVGFDRIKSLQVPWPFLVGFAQDMTKRLQDVVPRNIEFLTITDDLWPQNESGMVDALPRWEWTDDAMLGLLQSWLKDWKSCTPHLRGITLLLSWIYDDIHEWSPRMRDQLRELGAQAGVQLEQLELDYEIYTSVRATYASTNKTLNI